MEALDTSLRNLEPALREGSFKVIDLAAMKQSLIRLSLDWGQGARAKKAGSQ
jgi:hypothetical protein